MTSLNVKDLLLAARLDREQAARLLRPFGFKDPLRADANLQAMAQDPSERQALAEILEDLLVCVSKSADPDQALNYFERFARAAIHKLRFFGYLKDSPRTLEVLAMALGASPYMAEILIRDPHHFYWLTDPATLYSSSQKRYMRRELTRSLKVLEGEHTRLDYLRFFKRREMLRIGVRDLLRLCSVEETLKALSILAETLICAAYWICASELRRQHEIPRSAFTGFTILGMGKLGGGELNFSSDVDLIYVYESDHERAGTLSAPDYFRMLCRKISAGLNELTGEGYVYRVDLRLRPEGDAGHIAYPLDGFERYYETRVGTWERLALLKAWPVAGSHRLGGRFLKMASEFIYNRPFGDKALEDVRSMKKRIDHKMTVREQRDRNVKLGMGGIREIELIAQSLQVMNGARLPQICERNTLKALHALWEHALITEDECDVLTRAYLFLRDVENKLQMANDAQTHSLPKEPEQLTISARTLGYSDTETFLIDYRRHTSRVNGIFERRFSQQLI
jgi:[glutamine synthetase] adenylyltransferase / [glutamine synthetase]-adenylyl-L-tyrosine phosphorylase